MSYEIRKTTVFQVAGEAFDTENAAKRRALQLTLQDNLNNWGGYSWSELVVSRPTVAIDLLQAYIKDLDALNTPTDNGIWADNFDYGLAAQHDCFSMHDVALKVADHANVGENIRAIQLIRSMFSEKPGLLETKNWYMERKAESCSPYHGDDFLFNWKDERLA